MSGRPPLAPVAHPADPFADTELAATSHAGPPDARKFECWLDGNDLARQSHVALRLERTAHRSIPFPDAAQTERDRRERQRRAAEADNALQAQRVRQAAAIATARQAGKDEGHDTGWKAGYRMGVTWGLLCGALGATLTASVLLIGAVQIIGLRGFL